MARKSEAEIAAEIFESVKRSRTGQKKLKSSTFWRVFRVKSRQSGVVERTAHLLDEQGLKVSVKSGAEFGKEQSKDWIVLTLKPIPGQPPPKHPIPVEWPSPEWFATMKSREFESEREVETYFVTPLLAALGYEYDDIAIGYPVEMFKGVTRTTKEADFALFEGASRDKCDVLLIVEAKRSDKPITVEHVSQAQSYARELMPAAYVVTNGQGVKVFGFNGSLAPDDHAMDFDRQDMEQEWKNLFLYVGKKAAMARKEWLRSRFSSPPTA